MTTIFGFAAAFATALQTKNVASIVNLSAAEAFDFFMIRLFQLQLGNGSESYNK